MPTHTRVHTHITFADPWLSCTTCLAQVRSWHNPDLCGCTSRGLENLPCRHPAGTTSLCLTWSPVDGCTCLVEHAFP